MPIFWATDRTTTAEKLSTVRFCALMCAKGEARLRSIPTRCARIQNHSTKANARQAGKVGGLGLDMEAENRQIFH